VTGAKIYWRNWQQCSEFLRKSEESLPNNEQLMLLNCKMLKENGQLEKALEIAQKCRLLCDAEKAWLGCIKLTYKLG
jgi:hypothetical protein